MHGKAFSIYGESHMKLDIRIEGVTPLICNRFTDKAAQAATDGVRGSSAIQDRDTPHAIAESKLYIGLDGQPVIPQPNLMRCLVEGGRFHKAGKSQLTTSKSSHLYACVDIEGAEVPIRHAQPWKVDTRAVRIPATGGRILSHRPMFDDWALDFTVDLDEDICGAKVLRMVVDDAGKRIGLGDFRPACKGPYGKFVVTRWQASVH
jgi:hypothetical protein